MPCSTDQYIQSKHASRRKCFCVKISSEAVSQENSKEVLELRSATASLLLGANRFWIQLCCSLSTGKCSWSGLLGLCRCSLMAPVTGSGSASPLCWGIYADFSRRLVNVLNHFSVPQRFLIVASILLWTWHMVAAFFLEGWPKATWSWSDSSNMSWLHLTVQNMDATAFL